MKQEWVAAKELVALDGLPGTVQGIHQKARREGWRKEKRVIPGVKGHQVYFYLYDLPEKTQRALTGKEVSYPLKNDLNISLISMLEMTSQDNQLALFRAMCEFGIKGVLERLQQPTRLANDVPEPVVQGSRTLEEPEEEIKHLHVSESLKEIFNLILALAGNEQKEREILQVIKSCGRTESPGSNATTPDQEVNNVGKKSA